MPTLHLTQMKCINKQTTIGKDEILVYVGGKLVAGPYSPGKDEVAKIGVPRRFDAEIDLELREQDGDIGNKDNDDESLGVWQVRATQAGAGDLTATFHHLKHADYHVLYHVSDD